MKTYKTQQEVEKDIQNNELLIKDDVTFECSITISASIKVTGNINAMDINAKDINAGDINARDIICESRKKKSKTNKTIARVFVQGRSKLERKEQMPEAKK